MSPDDRRTSTGVRGITSMTGWASWSAILGLRRAASQPNIANSQGVSGIKFAIRRLFDELPCKALITMNYNWSHARANCLSFKRQFHERDTSRRTFAKVDPDTLFLLLDRCAFSAHEMRVRLRRDMLKNHWKLLATLHREGIGDPERPADEQLHLTVGIVKGSTYHVRCRERADESVYVFNITA